MQGADVLCLEIIKLSVTNVQTSFWTCFEAAESFELCLFTVLKLILFFVTSLLFSRNRGFSTLILATLWITLKSTHDLVPCTCINTSPWVFCKQPVGHNLGETFGF
jgi:hypothetical protein